MRGSSPLRLSKGGAKRATNPQLSPASVALRGKRPDRSHQTSSERIYNGKAVDGPCRTCSGIALCRLTLAGDASCDIIGALGMRIGGFAHGNLQAAPNPIQG